MMTDKPKNPTTPLPTGSKPGNVDTDSRPIAVVEELSGSNNLNVIMRDLIFQSSRDGIFVIDENGHYIDVNPAGCVLFGYTREEFLEADVKLLFYEEDVTPEHMQHQKELWKDGIDCTEMRLRKKDGSEIWVELSIQPFMINGVKRILGIKRGITERRQHSLALIESDFRFRTLFENSADAHLIIENEMFVDCNQATIDILGYESKEVFLETVHPATLSPPKQPDGRDSIEKAEEMMSIALEKGTHRFEWDHMRSNGEVFPAEVLLTTLLNEDDRRIIYTVWRDITDRNRAKDALLASQPKFRNVI
ncbi:MAG TPA: PAS domain S-box protein, partial [Bacteroidetes bacterium]|nr:PAS domain S-box protein [Bacteroidota bacterium]HEX03836.1 PAS domain S-box protein [Bacteroidota bacterium]